jgi:RES domain-containing protein
VLTAWRIVKATHEISAFDGEGARVFGGRWNSPGAPVVYTAESAALATLEMLVHLGKSAMLPEYILMSCTFHPSRVLRLGRERLPANWRAYPAPAELQLVGNAWIKSSVSAVLEIPNAIVPHESNYLLNPRHADFASVEVGPPQPFEMDLRLLRSLSAPARM